MPSVLQPWVQDLSYMQQSVLLAAIRGPDGLHKEHISKSVLRWMRRCVLISAFDGRVIDTPTEPGGGSFTGPIKHPDPVYVGAVFGLTLATGYNDQEVLKKVFREYLRCVDEVPHHFHLHLMHAAEILGYKHPVLWKRNSWWGFYQALVNDAHLYPESEERMDRRLGDVEEQWKAREDVPE